MFFKFPGAVFPWRWIFEFSNFMREGILFRCIMRECIPLTAVRRVGRGLNPRKDKSGVISEIEMDQ